MNASHNLASSVEGEKEAEVSSSLPAETEVSRTLAKEREDVSALYTAVLWGMARGELPLNHSFHSHFYVTVWGLENWREGMKIK